MYCETLAVRRVLTSAAMERREVLYARTSVRQSRHNAHFSPLNWESKRSWRRHIGALLIGFCPGRRWSASG